MRHETILSLGLSLFALGGLHAEVARSQEAPTPLFHLVGGSSEPAAQEEPVADNPLLSDLTAPPPEDALLEEPEDAAPLSLLLADPPALEDQPSLLISDADGDEVIPPSPASEEEGVRVDFAQVFAASPVIYSMLLALSVAAVCVWFYAQYSFRPASVLPTGLLSTLKDRLSQHHFEDALHLCRTHDSFFTKMVAGGLQARRYGLQTMVEAMQSEGKRATVSSWQKISLLNDIAIIAPMLGLLGTVLGMFYAFYDLNRSVESVSTLFDGLGISVGTTVGGLVVAILAMILQSLSKFRLVRLLALAEGQAQACAALIDSSREESL
jgi:biopolymer transport protein ExbB